MSGATPGAHQPLLRLCLDLNVFVADLLSPRSRDQRSAASFLVDTVRNGECPVGPVQLVVSHGMLNRLRSVLETRGGLDPAAARRFVGGVAAIAANGPSWDAPYLVLGGVGVVPMRDEEDRGVLEAAVGGRAHLLATANLRDFAGIGGPARITLSPGQVLLYKQPGKPPLVIAAPTLAARWLRLGVFPSEEAVWVNLAAAGEVEPVLVADEVMIDRRRRRVYAAGAHVVLTQEEYAILEHMALRKGAVAGTKELLSCLYDGPEPEHSREDVVHAVVAKLRKKLTGAGDVIRAVEGHGYALE